MTIEKEIEKERLYIIGMRGDLPTGEMPFLCPFFDFCFCAFGLRFLGGRRGKGDSVVLACPSLFSRLLLRMGVG